MFKITHDDNGHIIVETLGSFTMLIMVMAVIISLVNIIAVKSHIHSAMTQTALDMSMYAYVSTLLPEDSEPGIFSELSNGITNLSTGIAADFAGFFIDDYAAELLRKLASTYDEQTRQMVMDDAVEKIFVKYLCDDLLLAEIQANNYLLKYGIYSPDGSRRGLNAMEFSIGDGISSTMVDSNGDTIIIILYKIKFNIFNVISLPLYLDVQQTVKTKAWLGGIS